MTSPNVGRQAIEFLLERGRLERIDGSTALESANLILSRAARRLLTAEGGVAAGDYAGAFVASYDAYRMAAESLLLCQGLRATGGEGSHMTVEDAISGQYSSAIASFAKPTFERFRRTRHAAQYFDPSVPEISEDDAHWALSTAHRVVDAVREVLATDAPPLFSSG